ncbi:MAG: hypothetical protein WAK91_02320 [Candidatus Acidiferrales bacterium]
MIRWAWPNWRWPLSGLATTAIGIALLAVTLAARHIEAIHSDPLIFFSGWIGSILVIVGLGRILMLEDHWS